MIRGIEEVQLVEDPSHADWLVERLATWACGPLQAGALVADNFEAYGRVLHTASRYDKAGGSTSPIAEEVGRPLGPEVRFADLVG